MTINKLLTKVNRTVMLKKINKYIVIHYVGAVSSAKNNAYYFEKVDRQSSANYFVDSKEVWQTVDDDNAAWHCGLKDVSKYKNPECRNGNSIGIELCCKKDNLGRWYFEEQTIKNTQQLVAMLMEKYNIPEANVIRHYDVTGKICPEPFVRDDEAWIKFKSELKWIDDLNYLESRGRVNSSQDWVIKNYEQNGLLKYIFSKWANDVKNIP